MLSTKTGLSLNMAGHKTKGGSDSRRSAGIVYPRVEYLGPAYPAASGVAQRDERSRPREDASFVSVQ
jgi:hypothetical protein